MKQHFSESMYRMAAICGSLVVLSSLGCGGSEGLASVSGRLTFNGKPLEGIEIAFTSLEQEKTRPSTGICDADGNYTLMFTRTQKGATIGSNRVTIVQPILINGAPDYSVLRVPPEFGDESELEYTVKAGGNSGVDFDLDVPEDHIGQGTQPQPDTSIE